VPQKGLEEVVAASTRLSDVDGRQGRLWYVGYDIHDLATNSTFVEVTYLLHNLRLPTEPELVRERARALGILARERGVDHERGARAAVSVRRGLRAKGHAGGNGSGRNDGCDMCAYERHTYEHTTYDAI